MKKIIFILFLISLFVSISWGANLNFLFSSNTVIHSDEDYKNLYGAMAFGWDTGVNFEPILGADIGIKFGQSYDTGFLSYTKENISLNKNIITAFLDVYPLTLFMNDFYFYLEPFFVMETDIIMYKEKTPLDEFSGNKALFSFGGGICLNLKRKIKLLFSAKYRNLSPISPSIGREINTEGLIIEASLRLTVFNL